MVRAVIGGLIGGVAIWLVGFLFWGTPLALLAVNSVDATSSSALQTGLQVHLGNLGTGVYPIPATDTAQGTQAYAQGPTATIFYNEGGFPIPDTGALIGGLILAIVCAILLALALRASVANTSFVGRMRVVALFTLAITGYLHLGQPVFNHMPWGYFIYSWIADLLAFLAAGAVISRWFLPHHRPQMAEPVDAGL